MRLDINRYLIVVLMCSCYFIGCKKEQSEHSDRSWINEEEIAALKNKLSGIIEDNRSQTCPRAVLRGEPIEGPAEQDMNNVIDLKGELSACSKLLADKSEELEEILFYPEGKTHPGYPDRSGLTSRRLDDPLTNTKDVRDVEKACASIADRVDKAVSHRDACSPHRPAMGDTPLEIPSYIYFLRGSKGAIVVAREMMSNGEVSNAVELVLNYIRLGQDITRGSRTLIAPMIAAYVTRSTVSFLELVLNRRQRIGQDFLPV